MIVKYDFIAYKNEHVMNETIEVLTSKNRILIPLNSMYVLKYSSPFNYLSSLQTLIPTNKDEFE